MKSSLLSAIAGWVAGIIASPLAEFIQPSYALNGVPQHLALVDLFASAMVAAIYSSPAILAVWLLLLWPLYRIVPIKSILWRPAVCISCGAVVGAVLYYICINYIFGFARISHALFRNLRLVQRSVPSHAQLVRALNTAKIKRLTNRWSQPLAVVKSRFSLL